MAAVLKMRKCLRCGATWWPKSPKRPAHCAKCNSPYYDRERRK